MANRRRAHRFVLREPALVTVGERATGVLTDVSTSGGRLRIASSELAGRRVAPGGEIALALALAGERIEAKARVVWAEATFGHTEVGVVFPECSMLRARVEQAVDGLKGEAGAGAIHVGRDADVHVVGALSGFLCRELFRSVKATAPRKLVLNGCTAIDAAGIALVQICRERKMQVSGCRGGVRSLLGMALRCPRVCGGSCEA